MEIQRLIEELQRAMQSSGPRARVDLRTLVERNGHSRTVNTEPTAVRVEGVTIIIEGF